MPVAAKPEREVLTVSGLTAQIRSLLEGEFPSVWVGGEISNFTRASSGHIYFSLKDAKAQIRAAMFRGFNLRLRFDLRDGMDVLARGRLGVYESRGDYQFYVEEIQPKGVGAAELALQQLKQKLLAKGYFDPRRKKPLPRFPRRVALIASPTGAAIRDMIELFAQRWPTAEVIVHPSRVQGPGAAEDVAAAVRALNRVHHTQSLALDAIIIGRGGGSAEDLAAFNEEIVADAIFQSVVPVISAVGHEIDVSVADLVADVRAETPSAAVMALAPDQGEVLDGIREYQKRLASVINQRLVNGKRALDQIATRPVLRRPMHRIRELEQRLDDLSTRLQRAVRQRLAIAQEKMAAMSAQLDTLSPLNVLSRGYSLTRSADGKLVRDAADVRPGDELITRVASGEITSRVESR